MDPRPVRGCPPSARPALLLAGLAVILLAPQAAARGLDDPVFIPVPVDTEDIFEVKYFVVCGDSVCVWISSKPCVGVVAAGLALDVDGDTGVYVQGGAGPAAYGGYSERCAGRQLAYVYFLDP